MEILSSANTQLKLARRIRDSREEGLIFVEGTRLIRECLTSNLKLHMAFQLSDEDASHPDVLLELKARKCPIYETSRSAFNSISDTVSSQGVVLIASEPSWTIENLFEPDSKQKLLLVVMEQIQDPGNAGTIIRTAEAAGAHGVIALSGTTNPFAPKALRASMGSTFRLPVVRGTQLQQVIDLARAKKAQLVSADSEAELTYTEIDWTGPSILFVGNEGGGLTRELRGQSDARVRIPMAQTVESLNVATATAVILFEARRQRNEALAEALKVDN